VAAGVIRALFDRYRGLGEQFISWVQPRQIGAPTLARTTAPPGLRTGPRRAAPQKSRVLSMCCHVRRAVMNVFAGVRPSTSLD
jgi:hypothetical protein